MVGGQIPKIGIALSGGGSRAIAFHLGCLRTLHRLGILESARVMATVSGGSVIGAMYAVHEGSHEEFEEKVRNTLRLGFVRPALGTAVSTCEGIKALASFSRLLAAWLFLLPFRLLRILPNQSMPRRFASRTTILRRTFDRLLFSGKKLGNLPDGRPRLVIIAAELRTSTAFYFGKRDAGSYRVGTLDPAEISVAQAVAASAAYPTLLPALDETYNFRKRDGSLCRERVTLTDGGVYDNLGVAPLWPDRVADISIGVEELDTLVVCRAGYGARLQEATLLFMSRMEAVFNTVHARAQNAATKRLFDLKASGRLKSFVLPYLDQDDKHLKFPPADLVKRLSVADYPTNFSAMSDEWIDKLSTRGEQLTLAVIREHAPELLPAGWQEHPSIAENRHPENVTP